MIKGRTESGLGKKGNASEIIFMIGCALCTILISYKWIFMRDLWQNWFHINDGSLKSEILTCFVGISGFVFFSVLFALLSILFKKWMLDKHL